MKNRFQESIMKLNFHLSKDYVIEMGTTDNLKDIVENVSQIDCEDLNFPLESEKRLKHMFIDNLISYYILKKKDDVIGFIGISYENNNFIEVIYFYIKEEFRNKGIGKDIISILMNSFETIDFFVYATNEKMIKLLKSLGGQIIKDADNYGELKIRLEKKG